MGVELAGCLATLSAVQHGVVSRRQLFDARCSPDSLKWSLRTGAWRRVHPRVYALQTGPLTRDASIWAALLYAGDGAAASHWTAAELWGLLDHPEPVIHVTIGVERRVLSLADVRIHYAYRLPMSRHPGCAPPRTRVEDTVLDLSDLATSPRDVEGWVTRACQRRLTTPTRLVAALRSRKKIRWRKMIDSLLTDVAAGAESPLELGYLRNVERGHGLPTGKRQVRYRLDAAAVGSMSSTASIGPGLSSMAESVMKRADSVTTSVTTSPHSKTSTPCAMAGAPSNTTAARWRHRSCAYSVATVGPTSRRRAVRAASSP